MEDVIFRDAQQVLTLKTLVILFALFSYKGDKASRMSPFQSNTGSNTCFRVADRKKNKVK